MYLSAMPLLITSGNVLNRFSKPEVLQLEGMILRYASLDVSQCDAFAIRVVILTFIPRKFNASVDCVM